MTGIPQAGSSTRIDKMRSDKSWPDGLRGVSIVLTCLVLLLTLNRSEFKSVARRSCLSIVISEENRNDGRWREFIVLKYNRRLL